MAETIEQRKARLCRTIAHYEDMIVRIKESYSPHSTAVLYGILDEHKENNRRDNHDRRGRHHNTPVQYLLPF